LSRNRELIDTAVDLSPSADSVVQSCRVEVDLCCLRRGCRGRAEWRLALCERRADSSGYDDRIAMPVDVHVVSGRVDAQKVVVKRGDVDATAEQLCHYRLDLGLGQYEIAHDDGTAGRRLEAEPAAECQRGLDGYAVDSHLKVAARNAVAVDIALH